MAITRYGKILLACAGALFLLALPWMADSMYSQVLINMALINTVVVIGLNYIYGLAGIFSMAQAAFWGIGAYTSALLTADLHLSFWLALPAAGVCATLFSIAFGVPTLKLKSHYLTMATLGFAEIVRLFLMNFDRLTHGAEGIKMIPPPVVFGFALDTPGRFYYLNLLVAALMVLAMVRIQRSRLGRGLASMRDDELAAESMGVDVIRLKVMSFALSAFLGGIAGSLYAHLSTYICPDTFSMDIALRFVAMLLIGGAGTTAGPAVGAVFLTFLPEWLRFLDKFYMAIYGLGIVAVLTFMPGGITGLALRLFRRRRQDRPQETGG